MQPIYKYTYKSLKDEIDICIIEIDIKDTGKIESDIIHKARININIIDYRYH